MVSSQVPTMERARYPKLPLQSFGDTRRKRMSAPGRVLGTIRKDSHATDRIDATALRFPANLQKPLIFIALQHAMADRHVADKLPFYLVRNDRLSGVQHRGGYSEVGVKRLICSITIR